jgi:hypothetical protein
MFTRIIRKLFYKYNIFMKLNEQKNKWLLNCIYVIGFFKIHRFHICFFVIFIKCFWNWLALEWPLLIDISNLIDDRSKNIQIN